MGCDCAPFLANLYLMIYEYKYIGDLVSVDSNHKQYFKYCCRYIDDLCNPNGIINFDKVYKEIYLPCLILLKTNIDNKRATFLDIFIENNKFNTELCNKRKNFHFKVISIYIYIYIYNWFSSLIEKVLY